jgi:hypothetical protein
MNASKSGEIRESENEAERESLQIMISNTADTLTLPEPSREPIRMLNNTHNTK